MFFIFLSCTLQSSRSVEIVYVWRSMKLLRNIWMSSHHLMFYNDLAWRYCWEDGSRTTEITTLSLLQVWAIVSRKAQLALASSVSRVVLASSSGGVLASSSSGAVLASSSSVGVVQQCWRCSAVLASSCQSSVTPPLVVPHFITTHASSWILPQISTRFLMLILSVQTNCFMILLILSTW